MTRSIVGRTNDGFYALRVCLTADAYLKLVRFCNDRHVGYDAGLILMINEAQEVTK